MYANDPEMAKKWEKEESIDEANASVIRKKLLKQFGDDPLYKDFIIAKTPKEQKKALKTLKSIRGFNAVRLMQKYVKKLQDESIKGKLRNLIKQEIKSINEGFDKYHLGNVTDSKLKKYFQSVIKRLGGKVDAVGDDYIKFRLYSAEITKFPRLLKKLDKNKNVWIGDKRKKNIWDRRKNIDKLREAGFLRAKQMVFLPGEKIYFDPMTTYFWTMGPHGGPDLDDDPIEPSEKYLYQKIIKKLKSKDKAIVKKAMRTRKRRKEATTSVSVPGYLTPQAFSKSTQKAIDVDDEDDEKNESTKEYGKTLDKIAKDRQLKSISKKDRDILIKIAKLMKKANESMAAPFRRRNSRGLGRPMKVGLNEADLGLTYKRGKTVKVTHKKSGKELVIIDKPNVKREYEKIGYFAEGKVNELSMAPFSSSEAKLHINADIKDMSKLLGKTSQKVIKIMIDGVKGGKYTAMDISRGVQEGPAGRTHFGEMTFIQSLWNKMRDKFRRYSKDGKLS